MSPCDQLVMHVTWSGGTSSPSGGSMPQDSKGTAYP